MSREIAELTGELGVAVRQHQMAVDAFDEAVAAALGINRTDLRCLDVLMQSGATTPSRLGAQLGLTTGSVTAMLDRLAKLGYLTRAPDEDDRRRVVVRPTEQAARRAAQMYGPLAEEGAAMLAGYPAEALLLLIDFMQRSRELQERHVARVRDERNP